MAKDLNMFWIGILCALAPVTIAGGVSYGSVKAKLQDNTKNLAEVKSEAKDIFKKIEKNKEGLVEQEKVNMTQAIVLERTVKLVEKLEKKLEKNNETQ